MFKTCCLWASPIFSFFGKWLFAFVWGWDQIETTFWDYLTFLASQGFISRYINQHWHPLYIFHVCHQTPNRTEPHIVENWGIIMALLFLRLISWKSPPQSIKIFVKLEFFTNVLVVLFVIVSESFSCFLLSIKWVTLKRIVILVLTVAKMWTLNWVGRTFLWYVSSSKIIVIVFYYMWLSWWHTWKIYPWVIFQQT